MVTGPPDRRRVLTVSSNKGGVGKTTVAAHLALYVRALVEDLPVLVVGLDDQQTLDRFFAIGEVHPEHGNLKHAIAERSFDRVMRLGQYGIHFVPSPPDTALLKARATDPSLLGRVLDRTDFDGLVLFDTKSDLEALTRAAIHAADRVVVPVADRASLLEAERVLALAGGAESGRGRLLLTLVDRRSKGAGEAISTAEQLEREIDRRGLPRYRTAISRSPRVEALLSGGPRPLSILHHGAGTAVHREFRLLAEEVLADLGLAAEAPTSRGPARRPRRVESGGLVAGLAGALRRGLGARAAGLSPRNGRSS